MSNAVSHVLPDPATPLERLWHVVPAFPTISEVWLRLPETYRG